MRVPQSSIEDGAPPLHRAVRRVSQQRSTCTGGLSLPARNGKLPSVFATAKAQRAAQLILGAERALQPRELSRLRARTTDSATTSSADIILTPCRTSGSSCRRPSPTTALPTTTIGSDDDRPMSVWPTHATGSSDCTTSSKASPQLREMIWPTTTTDRDMQNANKQADYLSLVLSNLPLQMTKGPPIL